MEDDNVLVLFVCFDSWFALCVRTTDVFENYNAQSHCNVHVWNNFWEICITGKRLNSSNWKITIRRTKIFHCGTARRWPMIVIGNESECGSKEQKVSLSVRAMTGILWVFFFFFHKDFFDIENVDGSRSRNIIICYSYIVLHFLIL